MVISEESVKGTIELTEYIMTNRQKSQSVIHNSEDLLNKKAPSSKLRQFPVVGIGASAGGLEALEQFFTNMPANNGMAFVIIQHLDPKRKGILPELLQRVTKMKVDHVTDGMKINPDCVYVIPANKSMSILNDALYLFDPVEMRGIRLPIDFFFQSLADDRKERSIGIILSGMGTDGTVGLKSIKENGGIVAVQNPSSAMFDSMPRSALESVSVDIVATAVEIPAKLLSVIKQDLRLRTRQYLEKDLSSLEKIVILLRTISGNDFSQYKKTTIYRRIERRMVIHQIKKISLYVRYLQENPLEIEILFKELLIGVTSFFRDPEVWDHLRDNVLPSLFSRLPNGYMIRVWIPGCSTGEEAYTLAMIFKESFEEVKTEKNLSLQIFGTDIDNNAIEKARKGIFPAGIANDVSQDRLNRFFIKDDNYYRINPEIREMVVFAPQNLIKDPPFTKLDIISCRNLMIYLDAVLQNKLLSLFQYALNHDGLLLLGNSETSGSNKELFTAIHSRLRIYQRSNSSIIERDLDFSGSFVRTKTILSDSQIPVKTPDNLQTLTDQLLLQKFCPASVLVTDKGDIIYITGSTGKYLEPAAGKANMNLFAMAREGLRNELPAAFRKALQSHEKIVLSDIKIGSAKESELINVTIQQIEKPSALNGKILLFFADVPEVKIKLSKRKSGLISEITLQKKLELELQKYKEEIQSTREEMQTSQEELKSTNEELQSTNEELQSTNEELTTSKEEMQSLNEELHTVNNELQSKIDDSLRINNDMNNLLKSINIATLFLDKDLKIRHFTVPATKIFKLIQSDIGRVFTDQVNDLDYPGLYNDAREVLQTLVFKEKAVETRDGRWFRIRIMPYRTFEDKIDGLVITLIDISVSKQLENVLRESQLMLRSFIETVPGVIIGLSSDFNIIEFNPEAEKLFGRKRVEVIGKNYVDMFIPQLSRSKVLEDMNESLSGTLPNRYKSKVKADNGDELTIEWSAHKLLDNNGTTIGTFNIGINILKS
jgi:two-component system, chemotaxis family, CheB/CheR fusion protein